MTKETRSSDVHDGTAMALSLLEAGVPLTLLLDLATPMHSEEVYSEEFAAADWLRAESA
ncbi:MAG TPA: hypothetical protein VMH41_00470 [Mycobacteriales bacterium]|nr:hypothetical protein [Mycobacteriales bacterium]